MLASGKTVSQVAHELALSVKTVSTHRTRILKKMEMRTNAELTHYAVRGGLGRVGRTPTAPVRKSYAPMDAWRRWPRGEGALRPEG